MSLWKGKWNVNGTTDDIIYYASTRIGLLRKLSHIVDGNISNGGFGIAYLWRPGFVVWLLPSEKYYRKGRRWINKKV